MFGLGFGEILIVLLIALIFIGPKKLPELAKGLGKGIRDFQNAAKGFSDQMQETVNDSLKTDSNEAPKLTDATQQNPESTPTTSAEDKNSSQS